MWSIETEAGNGGLPKVVLRCSGAGADSRPLHSAAVYLFGATVSSYVHNGEEKIFMSSEAVFNGVKALRGGIPLVFPQFGQPLSMMPQHGFARTSNWQIAAMACDTSSARVAFTLSDSDSTLAAWPHHFKLTYTVVLTAASLRCDLQINCLGDAPFICQALLHTYIRIDDVQTLSIEGFNGLKYTDKTLGGEIFEDTESRRSIAGEVDRVYVEDAPGRIPDIQLFCGSDLKCRIVKGSSLISSSGSRQLSTDCVLWNPWVEKARALADMNDDGYQQYVCVEPGVVNGWTEVEKDSTLVLYQELFPV